MKPKQHNCYLNLYIKQNDNQIFKMDFFSSLSGPLQFKQMIKYISLISFIHFKLSSQKSPRLVSFHHNFSLFTLYSYSNYIYLVITVIGSDNNYCNMEAQHDYILKSN